MTGASSGVGLATVKALTARGFDVFASVRRERDVDNVRHACKNAPGSVTPFIMDVTDRPSILRAAAAVQRALGTELLVGLINCAGVAEQAPLLSQPIEAFSEVLDVNLIGVLAVTQAFAPLLGVRERQTWRLDHDRSWFKRRPGAIINLGAMRARGSASLTGAFYASKQALEAYSACLKSELRHYGVKVMVIRPRSIASTHWRKADRKAEPYLVDPLYLRLARERRPDRSRSSPFATPPDRIAHQIVRRLEARLTLQRLALGLRLSNVLTAKSLARWARQSPALIGDALSHRLQSFNRGQFVVSEVEVQPPRFDLASNDAH